MNTNRILAIAALVLAIVSLFPLTGLPLLAIAVILLALSVVL